MLKANSIIEHLPQGAYLNCLQDLNDLICNANACADELSLLSVCL